MGNKLYVGNLPFELTTDELSGAFSEQGEVKDVRIITDKYTQRSRGFGFVEMATDEQASQALEKLNGASLRGRNIVVKEARPQESSGGGRQFSHEGGRR